MPRDERAGERGVAGRPGGTVVRQVGEHLATHVMPLDDGPKGYRMFEEEEDGCVRAVFGPGG